MKHAFYFLNMHPCIRKLNCASHLLQFHFCLYAFVCQANPKARCLLCQSAVSVMSHFSHTVVFVIKPSLFYCAMSVISVHSYKHVHVHEQMCVNEPLKGVEMCAIKAIKLTVSVCVFVFVCTCAHAYVCVWACVSVFVYVCAFVCVCGCGSV